MRKYVILFILVFFSTNLALSQKKQDSTKKWTYGSLSSFTIAQSAYQNWIAGGDNSLAINGYSKNTLSYSSKRITWANNLNMSYGMIRQQGKDFRKTDDNLEFNTQYGYKAFENFYYTMLFNFKTQFSAGYDYLGDTARKKTSNFMAPAYLVFSVGMNYTKKKEFQLFFSPISGKITLVLDPDLYPLGVYGVDPGKKVRYELGAYAKINYHKEILKNVTVIGKITLFSNYLHNPQNIDINYEGFLAYKITDFLTFNINTKAIYDDDVKIKDPVTGHQAPKLQLMEVFGLGVTVKLPNKK